MEFTLLIATIGVLGIGSQWLAWRFQLPAIVTMLLAGLIAGPLFGWINPEVEFGDLFRPLVSVAVALILFEGGITLDFRALRDARPAVRRLVIFGAPLGWLFSTLTARYVAGLSWESSIIFGGVLIVTGPTVVTPLLRQARLERRPSEILRWEAIVNDPVGALAAVFAFEILTYLHGEDTLAVTSGHLIVGIFTAVLVGYIAGKGLVSVFRRGLAPEYMKVPILLGLVLLVYALTDHLLHESGLLAVTVMGVVIGNAHLPSLGELRRFKEHVTVILVSGVFVMLAASLPREMLMQLDWRALGFVLAIMFVARPLAVLISLLFTEVPWKERLLAAWIGPRGIVAVAVTGLFATRLVDLGVEDGALLPPLAFALVAATVVAHGFTIHPLARWLGLTSKAPPGVLIVGGSFWSAALAKALSDKDIPVLLNDRNWFRLRRARQDEVPVFYGEILSETAEHTVDFHRYGTLLAVSDNDDYNSLVCTDFGPEFGRRNILQIGRYLESDRQAMPATIGGRKFGSGLTYEDFNKGLRDGWTFKVTGLTEKYGFSEYRDSRPDAEIIGGIRNDGTIRFRVDDEELKFEPGDAILAFEPGSNESS